MSLYKHLASDKEEVSGSGLVPRFHGPDILATMAAQMLYRGQLLSTGSAAGHESNLVLYIRHQRATVEFSRLLWDQKESIAALVRSLLGLRNDDSCIVLPPDMWISGGFNLCVLVEATVAGSPTKLVFRCPMPHKLAEQRYPGTIDEKLRCEVGAYAWIQQHCREIRIPSLYAFGFTDGSQVCYPRPSQPFVCCFASNWLPSSLMSTMHLSTHASPNVSAGGHATSSACLSSRTTTRGHQHPPWRLRICSSNISAQRRGGCFPRLGTST